MTLALGVLISGTGTNLGAILDAIGRGALAARVCVVLSNRADAGGLDRARAAGVPAVALSHRDFPTREAYDDAIVTELRRAGVEWLVLAGFMRVVTPVLLDAFPDRVLNVHPSLLPAFPGVDAQRQALEYGARVAGCTVHFVDRGVDTGPIIAQAAVPVLEGDDRDTLASRILAREHALLVGALAAIAAGRVQLEPPSDGGRRRVRVEGEAIA